MLFPCCSPASITVVIYSINFTLALWAANLKEEFSFLHLKPYNKDTYDHIQHYYDKQSSELELLADVTASWKQ